MENICPDPLWDPNLSWNTTLPDLTRCFKETVLVWVPCGTLFIASIFELLYHNGRREARLPWTALNAGKLLVGVVLAAMQICELLRVLQLDDYTTVEFWSPLIQMLAMKYSVLLLLYHKFRGQITSPSLWLFWLLYTVATGARYWSAMLAAFDTENAPKRPIMGDRHFIAEVIVFPLALVQFVLNCFSDRRLEFFVTKQKKQNRCPENDVSFLSQLTFWWFNGMILLGRRLTNENSGLQLDDMWELDEPNTTEGVVKHFLPSYNAEAAKKQVVELTAEGTRVTGNRLNILCPLIRTYGWQILGIAGIKFVAVVLTFVGPTILNALITFVESDEPIWKGIFFAFVMLASSMCESFLNSQYEYKIYRVAMRIRSAVIHVIYVKALKLSGQAKGQFTTGEVVNLMAVDTQRIMDQLNMMNMIWTIPLQTGIAIYLLWQQLGIATLGGIGVMLLLMPINAVITGFLRKYQTSLMKEKDKRTKLMNEILSGIKVLKLYAWERPFMQRIEKLRGKELSSLRSQAWLSGFMVFAFTSAPFLVSLASFATYVLMDPSNVLDANKAFVSLSLFNILRVPLALLPVLIMVTAMFFVSMNRINKYLRCEELDPDAVQKVQGAANAIHIKNGTFQYSASAPAPILSDINIEVKRGQLVAIVGTVGAGKTTLLSAVLGDIVKKSGSVTVSGSTAYVPQQAWIQGTSIKNNILFGRKYERARYEQVLHTCGLEPDLQILPGGDETEVGEKGINLSGGQKQRISLARAVYSESDIYFFDDPLSAVDSHVSKHIFEKVISNKGVLSGKTRLLVTHRLAVLEDCDVIYVLKGGKVSESGTYRDLVDRKGAFAEFLIQHLQEKSAEEEIPEDDLEVMEKLIKGGRAPPELTRQLSRVSGADSDSSSEMGSIRRRFTAARDRKGSTASSVKSDRGVTRPTSRASRKAEVRRRKDEPGAALTKEEESQVGSVSWRVYRDYALAMGVVGSVITVLSYIVSNGFNLASSIWLSDWSEDSKDPELFNSTSQRDYRLSIYAVWGVGETLFALVASILLNLIALKGGQVLHERMLNRVLRAPMSFFDTTPMGRVLNRFSKDIDTADVTMRFNLRMVLMQFLRTMSALVLIAMQTPLFLALVIPLAILYYGIQTYYIATSRQLKRIESTSRSPIYVHFSETLTGSTSIRAYDASERFIELSNTKTDVNNMAYYPSLAASRWLSIRLEFIGYVIVFISATLAVLSRDTMSSGTAGLSISYALTLTATLNMLVKSTSDIEMNFVSVERCLEYSEVEVEADWVVESNRPSSDWPQEGAVEFHKYAARYRVGLPLVVKDITVKFQPGEKVGVVGRTGAGKSTLTLSLFRLIEAAEGHISIDSLNISRIGLHDLRSKLTIIPQDPMLFSGTLRENLDPFGEKSDDTLWAALDHAYLKQFATEQEQGLAFEIIEGGENMSVGQRQLVCLARALLRKTKILVLDEATAAVDMETDSLIQETLQKEFKESTTITIAHRLNTILDYDRVMVLDDGRVVEFDSPKTLLDNKESIFYGMAKDAGLV